MSLLQTIYARKDAGVAVQVSQAMSGALVQGDMVQKATPDEIKAALVEVLQENQRLEITLGIMREQHALVAELLSTQLAVDAERKHRAGEAPTGKGKEVSHQH